MRYGKFVLLAFLVTEPCFGKIWAYNAMTIRADDAKLKKKVRNGKICFSVNSEQDLKKNFPELSWTTEKNKLVGHANQKSKHMFSLFPTKEQCVKSARIASESGHVELGGLGRRKEGQTDPI